VGQLGHTTDVETGGLIHMRARYCDPATGRFVSEDPGAQGVNWFRYCDCDPVNKVDKDGRAPGSFWLGLLLAMFTSGIYDGNPPHWNLLKAIKGAIIGGFAFALLSFLGGLVIATGSIGLIIGLAIAGAVVGGLLSYIDAKTNGVKGGALFWDTVIGAVMGVLAVLISLPCGALLVAVGFALGGIQDALESANESG
jgi:RHS repeat-associated protein